jgi:hypothetical protein
MMQAVSRLVSDDASKSRKLRTRFDSSLPGRDWHEFYADTPKERMATFSRREPDGFLTSATRSRSCSGQEIEVDSTPFALACLHGWPRTPVWLAAWPLYCKLLQPILNPMLCRVSFLYRENQLTKAPRLPIVMFRAAHAVLFTFAQQRGRGNFKSCARNCRPGSRPSQGVRAEGVRSDGGMAAARSHAHLRSVGISAGHDC